MRLIDVDELEWFKCRGNSGDHFVLLPFNSIYDIPKVNAYTKDQVLSIIDEISSGVNNIQCTKETTWMDFYHDVLKVLVKKADEIRGEKNE